MRPRPVAARLGSAARAVIRCVRIAIFGNGLGKNYRTDAPRQPRTFATRCVEEGKLTGTRVAFNPVSRRYGCVSINRLSRSSNELGSRARKLEAGNGQGQAAVGQANRRYAHRDQ